MINPATSVETLEGVLATEGAQRSATTQHRLDADPVARLRDAATRYRSAVESLGAPRADGGGPLPWLPSLPDVADQAFAAYLSRRFDLVCDLAAELPVADALPDTRWAAALRAKDADLAQHLAVWRATNGVDRAEFRPCGPANDGDAHRQLLGARVDAAVGSLISPDDQWRQLADRLVPGIVDEPAWPRLAAALTRAIDAGYDVPKRLPALIDRRPLPPARAAQSLYYRLGDDCPDAFAPIPSNFRYSPPATPSRPAPLPDYARSLNSPSVSRGGPHR